MGDGKAKYHSATPAGRNDGSGVSPGKGASYDGIGEGRDAVDGDPPGRSLSFLYTADEEVPVHGRLRGLCDRGEYDLCILPGQVHSYHDAELGSSGWFLA